MLDLQTAELLKALDVMSQALGTGPRFAAIDGARAYSAAVFKAFAGPDNYQDSVLCQDIHVGGATGMRPARTYRPAAPSDAPMPVVVFFHGGGWVLGDLDSYDGLMRALSALSGAILISVNYRLAPENPFPAGLQDCIAATRWIAGHAHALGTDSNRLAVMGDSAGGNLAAAVCLDAALRRDIPIAAQYLIYPVIDVSAPHESYPSRIEYGNGDFLLTRDAIEATRNWYLGSDADAAAIDPRVSPLFAAGLIGLPPTYIMTAGHDPLRDEAKAYAALLTRAGVETRYQCFDTAIHAFLSFGVLDVAHVAREALADEIRRTLAIRSD